MCSCHCSHENETVKGNVGIMDEMLDEKRKRKILSSKFLPYMIQKCWINCWIRFSGSLYFKMSVALSGLALICNSLEERYFCHLHAYPLACFYEIHLKFLTCHIYFHLEDCALSKQ